jgi:thiamine-phosphate pyrophosphorylase
MLLGRSTHSLAEAEAELQAGADYAFLGPVFASPEKLRYGAPLGLETAAEAARSLGSRIVAIGGIGVPEAAELGACGIKRIAAIRSLQAVPDIGRAVGQLRAALQSNKKGGAD